MTQYLRKAMAKSDETESKMFVLLNEAIKFEVEKDLWFIVIFHFSFFH